MRRLDDQSPDFREISENRPAPAQRPADMSDAEIAEQTEAQADTQPELTDQAVEVPEQTEAEADAETGDRRGAQAEGEDVPEQGHEIADGEITGGTGFDEVPEEEGIISDSGKKDLQAGTEEGIQSDALDDLLASDKEEHMDSDHGDLASDEESVESTPLEEGSEHKKPIDASELQSWLGDINPNFDEFDPESPYCNNCGSCAFAVYQRLEGDTEICAGAENIGYNEEMEALTGMEQVSMDPSEIEKTLLEQGDGAHAIIGIDRAEGPGHWFNAACIDGKVVAIDGQTGEIRDWPPDYGDVVNWEMSVKK